MKHRLSTRNTSIMISQMLLYLCRIICSQHRDLFIEFTVTALDRRLLACESRAGESDKLFMCLLLCACHLLRFKTCLDVQSLLMGGATVLCAWPGGLQRNLLLSKGRFLGQRPQEVQVSERTGGCRDTVVSRVSGTRGLAGQECVWLEWCCLSSWCPA